MSFNPISRLTNSIWEKVVGWLTHERENKQMPLSDFERLRYEIRPGDVILVEGRSRVSEIIKTITLSNWTHSALYIGRLHDIEDHALRAHVQRSYNGDHDDPLVIESLLGQGTVVDSIRKYSVEHLRICRPNGLTRQDSQKVIAYAVNQLGTFYNVRQILDLARFLFPYTFLPRRWRSSLFEHNAGAPTHNVCSSMMAEAFSSVHFPILPVLHRDEDGNLKMYKRNTKLITPKDFDYSPYFDVIKYPILDFDELAIYRKMPWSKDGVILNNQDDDYIQPSVDFYHVEDVNETKDMVKDQELETKQEKSA
ncbi:MAG: YiiX/YebB-like N1pC/P60 family cysteine hydrolase [Gammaproteobacteria bacterium]|nr:YiiX/YebB-like N1pC/P60 family cysteine hydrolase [Gammaproteobacteria bacterium]MDH5735758.1 YiiX/YebB-like N1pC/P60 family cysteine hydrolase [Gammaproteobacteria bacterium]